MQKKLLITFFITFQILSWVVPAYSEYETIYHYYLDQGFEAYFKKDYYSALVCYKIAHAIDPTREEASRYFNLALHLKSTQTDAHPSTFVSELPHNKIDAIPVTEINHTEFQPPKPENVQYVASEPEVQLSEIKTEAEDSIPELVMVKSNTVSFATNQDEDKIDELVIKPIDLPESKKTIIPVKNQLQKPMVAVLPQTDLSQRTKVMVRKAKVLPKPVEIVALESIKPEIHSFEKSTKTYIEDNQEFKEENNRNEKINNDDNILPISMPALTTIQSKTGTPKTSLQEQNLNIKPNISAVPDSKSDDSNKNLIEKIPTLSKTSRSPVKITSSSSRYIQLRDREEIRLDDNLWKLQAQITFELEVGTSVVFVGKNIKRTLATIEDLLEVSKIDADRRLVKAVKRGNTLFYIWDDHGRWALNIHCVYANENAGMMKKKLNKELASPFRVTYKTNWNSFHSGPTLGNMTRKNLSFTNVLGVEGETPYGYFDASADSNMYATSTEIVGQRLGLSDAHIGPFNDFSIRAYDTYARLTDLTLASRYFRGIALTSYAFRHKIAYSYFKGQDQSISIYSSAGTFPRLKSYVEGFKVTLYPQELDNYSFNFARGYGDARPIEWPNKAYSLETNQKFGDFNSHAEVGYDETKFATILQSRVDRTDFDLTMAFRAIPKGYQSIFGRPGSAGQITAMANSEWKMNDYKLSTYVNFYHELEFPNPDHPNLINFDGDFGIYKDIDESSSWAGNISYQTTPQTVSPRQFAQLGSNYSKYFKVFHDRYISLSLGQNFQWSRNEFSSTSDYDRLGLRAGLRTKLLPEMYYSLSYEFSGVHDVSNSRLSYPSSLLSGVDYSILLKKNLTLNLDLTYRNDFPSNSNFSFLANQDSISNNISLTYSPFNDTQIYMDSQLRRVWPDGPQSNQPPFDDWSLMLGMRSSWDLPFRWNPTGEIYGVIYKDYNNSGLQDKSEPGMAGVKIMAGNYETLTNENGEFLLKVSAKKVTVSVDISSIPQGFVFSTALSREVVIEHGKRIGVNFGLTAQSGVYGIAFVDANNTGKPDGGDKFIANIIVRLDSGDITKTDPTGSYFFENIKPGKHKIRIDVNSIPIEYLPAVKVETEVNVREGETFVHNIPLKENPTSPAANN